MPSSSLSWQDISNVAQSDIPFVLVTVYRVKGSSPREGGARMLITSDGFQGSIGGGSMEFQAIQVARDMLSRQEVSGFNVIETPLTPKFDQCCGGQVTLVFEKIKKHPLHWTAKLPMYLKGVNGSDIQDHYGFVSGDLGLVTRVQDNEVLRYWTSEEALAELEKFGAIFEPLRSSSTLNIVLFGAGHVGRALVHFLLPLDVHITWVDSRDHIFPLIKSPKLKCIQTEDWQKIIRQSSSDSYFLVMTHSHQLDYQLTEAILMKNSFLYFGLIGSLKKRQRFERQLLKRLGGEISGSLKQMTCPIGLPSIKGKSPEVIAASVVAQLLSIHTRVSAEKNVTSKEVYYV